MDSQTYQGAAGLNFFQEDEFFRGLLKKRLPERIQEETMRRLSAFGALCGGRLAELIETAHRPEYDPKLVRYDRWGERIDRIEYCTAMIEARRLALEAGALPPTPLYERMTMAYLLNHNGEGGITCPLAMTDGLVQLLEAQGTLEQKTRYRPLLQGANGETPLSAGQFITEKQGGSNVSENKTEAVKQKDGSWKLTGLKWFCSNPGELWVTTAKPRGSSRIALFLMPRKLPDGSLNEAHILRLKDLSGTRGKATAEVEFKGAYAELIGRVSRGLPLLLRTVLRTSRIHVAAASLGFLRRAELEAAIFCRERIVLGHPAAKFAHVRKELETLVRRRKSATLAFFAMLDAVENGSPAAEVLVPMMKIHLSQMATDGVRRARLLFAGHGTLRDFSILPRLTEDALIQEIWEGTHPILAGHAAKALLRPRSGSAFRKLLHPDDQERLSAQTRRLAAAGAPEREEEALPLCQRAFSYLAASQTGATAAAV